MWNRSPVQAGCMRQVLGAGALGWPREMGWGGRWEGGSGWGTHVTPWLIHVNVWQKPLQYCKVISVQLIKQTNKKTKVNQRIYTYIASLLSLPPSFHPSRSSRSAELSSWCNTASSHWLSILHMVVYIHISLPIHPTLHFPLCVNRSVLYICISNPVLEIGNLYHFSRFHT